MAVHIIFRALRSTKYSLVKFTSSQSFIILRVGINSDTTKNNRTSYNVVTPPRFTSSDATISKHSSKLKTLIDTQGLRIECISSKNNK